MEAQNTVRDNKQNKKNAQEKKNFSEYIDVEYGC
jgi:hypothetical protein